MRASADLSTWLNGCLEAYNYPLPNPEDIYPNLSGARILYKVDLSESYHQIPVDGESDRYLTINTWKIRMY